MRFAYAILNYNTSLQTVKCIDAILARAKNSDDVKIAVLDNGSRDFSLRKMIQEKYLNFERGGAGNFL